MKKLRLMSLLQSGAVVSLRAFQPPTTNNQESTCAMWTTYWRWLAIGSHARLSRVQGRQRCCFSRA